MFIDVYKGEGNFVTSGATLLSDLDLLETYRALDSVATGRRPSLSCDYSKLWGLAEVYYKVNGLSGWFLVCRLGG